MSRPRNTQKASSRLGTVLLWVTILSAYLYPLFLFPIHNPNERARVYMTAAMWEFDTFAIGYRKQRGKGRGFKDSGSVYDRWGYVNDKALVCDNPDEKAPDCEGTLYSAKAPGASFLGYPFYGVLKSTAILLERDLPIEAIILYLRLFSVVLPSILMLFLFRRFAGENGLDPIISDLCTMGLALGSMVYTYSHMFAGHQIAAYLLFFGFYTAWKSRKDNWWGWPFLTALTTCLAVCVEYPMVLVTLALFLYQMKCRFRVRTFLLFCAGAIVPGLLTVWFHQAAFGSPFATPYTTLENKQFVKDIAPGFMGLREPKLENIFGSFLSPYLGMFYFAPWLALVVPGIFAGAIVYLRRKQRGLRKEFIASSVAVLLLTLFISCHSLWRGGWTLGPRYIVPFVPFAAVIILLVFGRLARVRPGLWRVPVSALVLCSVAVTGICSMVSQGFHTAFFNPLTEAALPLLKEGYVTYNLGNLVGLRGIWSIIPLFVVVMPGLAFLAWRAAGADRSSWPKRVFMLALTILLASACFKGLTLPTADLTLRKAKALAFTKRHILPFGNNNNDLDALEVRNKAASLFPRQNSVQALKLSALLAEGKCKQTLFTFKNWKSAEREMRRHIAFSNGLMLASPFPCFVPVPLLLRPDFEPAMWEIARMERLLKNK